VSYSAEVLADSPALYWRLGEVSGSTAADASGNGRTGTYGAGVTLGQGGALTNSGDTDTAALFNDSSSGLINSTFNPFAAAVDRTFECWAKRTDNTSADMMWGGPNSAGGRPTFQFSAGSDTISFTANDGGAATTWASAASAGAWHHIVLVYRQTADRADLYVDGALVASNVYTNDFAGGATNGNFTVGQNGSGGNNGFKGLMDEVAVYLTALPAARILAHYNAGNPPPVVHSDSVSGGPTAAGTRTESQTARHTLAGTEQSAGTRVEFFVHSRTASGAITATGSRTETWGYADAPSGNPTAGGANVQFSVHSAVVTGGTAPAGATQEQHTEPPPPTPGRAAIGEGLLVRVQVSEAHIGEVE
jgi:Concanavalin A-like lectin/glucanases superfamily